MYAVVGWNIFCGIVYWMMVNDRLYFMPYIVKGGVGGIMVYAMGVQSEVRWIGVRGFLYYLGSFG